MKTTYKILRLSMVDPHLASEPGVHLSQQRRRNIDVWDSTHENAGRPTHRVNDDSSAERDDDVTTLHPGRN